jgi:hypothetical protein
MAQRKGPGKRAGIVAAGVAAAAAAVAIAARLRGRPMGRRPGRGGPATAEPAYWTCACGERFRTVGAGRHQVHWLAEAPESEPLLGDACPSCGRALVGVAA